MRPLPRLLTALALALTASATQSAAQAGEAVRLGPSPVLGGGEYSTGGGVTVAVELRNRAGRTGLCGVWAESERLTVYVRRKGWRVLQKGTITLDGRVLTHNLNFLNQVAPAASYAGAPAGCVRLDRPWRAGDEARKLEIRIPRQDLHFDSNGRKSGGLRITFRDTGKVNPALGAGSLLPKSWTSFDLAPGGGNRRGTGSRPGT